MTTATSTDAKIVALLNDLLQLDHDALEAYTLAIKGVDDPLHRETLEYFRGDHERHIEELTPLIESRGGKAIQLPHLPTGKFKLAVQAAGNIGGEREVLMAFKANERQVRDKYLRLSAEELPRDVAEVVSRNAADEVKHYAWASEAMEVMEAGPNTAVGKAEDAFETFHARAADMIEGVGRKAVEQAERMRTRARAVSARAGSPGGSVMDEVERIARESPAAALAVAVAAGVVLRRILR
jgi:rubrerythrin